MTLRLGKKPARENAVTFRLRDYVDLTALPKPPARFGHEGGIPSWGMLGNDRYGDCVLAGGAHETMLWNAEARKVVTFTDECVLSDYSAITGFDPNDPASDQGTDMQAAASYRRKTGLVDADGNRHKIAAYLAITPGNVLEHLQALYLFGAVGVGIKVPAFAIDQFNENRPWCCKRTNTAIQGGHYIPLVAKRGYNLAVTWARLQKLSNCFMKSYNDESIAYVSDEMLTGGVSPEGFYRTQLLADLEALG